MDIASLIGILSGLSLIISAILIGGEMSDFVNVPGMMIVLGGTISATLLTFPFKNVLNAFKSALIVFSSREENPNTVVAQMMSLSTLVRRKGVVALENIDADSNFMKKVIQMVSDNAKEEIVYAALRTEIESLKARHFTTQEIFRKMAAYAPSFGMLGTLIGLIQMLSTMDDPSNIGPGMAIALITTFYGIFLATMFFLPAAGKLKSRTLVKVTNLEITYEGVISIVSEENPRMLYERVIAFIPNKERKSFEELDHYVFQ